MSPSTQIDFCAGSLIPLRCLASQVFGGDKAKARKVASLHQDVRALQTAQVAAEAEYDRVLGRNREVRLGLGLLTLFSAGLT